MKKYSIENIVIMALLAVGVLLSLFQFLYNKGLWLDEAMLALNIINKNAFELLKPLDYNQVAPILFLLIEKLFSTILPNTEYGLRLFPLLCFWASIYFFYQIIKIQLKSIYAVIMALSLFVTNFMFVFYASEAKQYMIDVFVLLFAFYFVLRNYKNTRRKFYALGIVGILAIFLSNVSPIILSTCGIYLLYDEFFVSKRKNIIPLLLVFVAWLVVFLGYYCLFIYEHPTKEYMQYFWHVVGGFLPHDSFKKFLLFLYESKNSIVLSISPLTVVIDFLLLVGIVYLIWQKKVQLIILTCTPVFLHLFLSTFQIYPFSIRTVLYVLPCVILICSAGFDYIINTIVLDLKIKRFRFIAILLAVYSVFVVKFPIQFEEIKKSMKYIQQNKHEGENIYIYHFAIFSYKYYEQIGFTIEKANIIEGKYYDQGYHVGDIRELDDLHGKNWLLFAHGGDDEPIMINHVDSMGYSKIKEFKTAGSSAYLYDFGE
jgi:hypothetical protein